MKWHAAYAVSAVVALALAAALAGQAHAACGIGQRIDHDNADCLRAEWDNSINWLSHGEVKAQNQCSNLGTVVVKVDLVNATDYTWHLDHGNEKKRNTRFFNVEGVHCCKDLSDLCNRSDVDDD